MRDFRLLVFNKPMNVLTRFTDSDDRDTLANYIKIPDVYPVGRLDRNSEGLLLLTDYKALVEPLLAPGGKRKEYLVCVEGQPTAAQLKALREGPVLKDGPTDTLELEALEGKPDWLWPREPPIRFRKSIPVSWLRLVIDRGRNRQVRRMTAAVGLPTLRLVRTGFAGFTLESLGPGEWCEASDAQKKRAVRLVENFQQGRRRRPKRHKKKRPR